MARWRRRSSVGSHVVRTLVPVGVSPEYREVGRAAASLRHVTTTEDRRVEPVVLPFRPRQGWREAGRSQRAFAVLCALLLLGWLASLSVTWDQLDALDRGSHATAFRVVAYVATLLVLVAGPPACYAAARVLRPHPPGTSGERVARHWCAATATAYGAALLTWAGGFERGFPLSSFGAGWIYILVAPVLGLVSLVWGVVAALRRRSAKRQA